MSFFDRFINIKKVEVENSEPNTVYEFGFDDVNDNTDENSVDWNCKNPDLVRPTIINLRKCANTPYVHGIINDFVIKSISGFEIVGDDTEAVECIREQAERWDLKSLMYEVAMNNFIDGQDFYEIVWENNLLNLRQLAFDGENYRIKEVWNETGTEISLYSQYVRKCEKTDKGWNKSFFELVNHDEEWVTVNFTPEQITVPTFFTRRGKPHSMVKTVLDKAYMIELLSQMLPQIVYKQANTMIMTVGNKDRKEIQLNTNDIEMFRNMATDYHKKGLIIFPYGVSAEMIGETVLPKVQEYINTLKEQVYIGLVTPEAVFSSSSSNRSTAVVQLDSDKSGRVLMQEFLQNKLNRWLKLEIFNKQLEKLGKKTNSVWLDFKPEEKEDLEPEQEEDGDLINVKTNTGTNLDVIENGEARLKEVK